MRTLDSFVAIFTLVIGTVASALGATTTLAGEASANEEPQVQTRDEEREIVTRLLEVIPAPERETLGLILSRTTSEQSPFRSGIRHRSSRSHDIYWSSGFLAALKTGSDAALIADRTQSGRELVTYSKYFVSTIQARWGETHGRGRTEPPLSFAEYLPRIRAVDPERLRSAVGDPLDASLNLQSLAWVTAHQVEHARWTAQHTFIPKRITPELERAFDRNASALAHEAGYAPTPVFTNALLFSAVEYPGQGVFALCRAVGILADGFAIADEEAASKRHRGSASSVEQYLKAQREGFDRLRLATGCARDRAPGAGLRSPQNSSDPP